MLAAISDPMTLALDGAREATVLDDLPLPWTRVVRIEGQVTTPFLVREQGWWYARGSQPGDGARWLRLLHTAGDTIQIVGGPAVLARTRPGPGPARLLAMRDPEPGAVTVRVLQPDGSGCLCLACLQVAGEHWIEPRQWRLSPSTAYQRQRM